MAGCCNLTRRQLLRWAAIVASSPMLAALPDPERAYGVTSSSLGVPINLELVTLTETSAIITWFTGDPTVLNDRGQPAPIPADTEVLLGTSPAALRTVFHDSNKTPYHYVELTGLEPGQTYFYVARSGGVVAAPSVFTEGNPAGTSAAATVPFAFTTPHPPPGRFLFSIALCNDLHLGETVAGLITSSAGGVPPGITQVPGQAPYSQIMAAALAEDARYRGASLLLAAGDISSEAAPADLAHARSYLDGFGAFGRDYLVARGNHDRPHTGTAYDGCRADPGHVGYHDCFEDQFFPASPTWYSASYGGLRLVGLDTYDKFGNGGDNGALSPAQWSYVQGTLAKEPDRPTIVFGHHPVSLESTLTTTEPVFFDLNVQQATQLQQLYAKTPGVFLHHSGHTHRNRKTGSTISPRVTFQEVSAVKEYPGGFHLLRLYTGGFALNFYKFRSLLAREWAERSRQEDFGGYPFYVFGNVQDRNSVTAADLSGLTPAPTLTVTPAPTPVPAPGSTTAGTLPVTGDHDLLRPAVGAVVGAAAVTASAWLRSRHGRDGT